MIFNTSILGDESCGRRVHNNNTFTPVDITISTSDINLRREDHQKSVGFLS